MKLTYGMTTNNNDLYMFIRAARHMASQSNQIMLLIENAEGMDKYSIIPLLNYCEIPEMRKPRLIQPFFPKQLSDYSMTSPNGSIERGDDGDFIL